MWLILVVLLLTLLYFLIQRNYNYWSKKGVPGPKPKFLIGNFGDNFIGKRSSGQIVTDIYREYEHYPFVGIYKATTPNLIVRDPELIKRVMVSDFKHFQNNDINVDKDSDPIGGRNPFVLKGTEWKNKRAQLTGCFTSGKIKAMYYFLELISKRMVKYVEDETKISGPLEAREVCVRFTLDNIAVCAFGVDGKSFDEPFSEFRDLAEKFMSPGNLINKLKLLLVFNFPAVTEYIKFKVVPREVEDRLLEIIRNTLKYRRENNITRNDFLDVCTRLNTETGRFTEIDIAAHGASFFIDGYETSSRVMNFLLFELAANPESQVKLREELNESFEKNGNTFTYEALHDLPFLDACLKESMRKNSPLHNLSKVCTKDYTFISTNPDFKNLTVKLKVGDRIAIPIIGLQMDPKYFEEPDKFIPERFLNKDNIDRFTYLPFGEGPRICLGQRFAVTQIKIGISYLIKNFQCTVNSKTQLPLKYDPYFFMLDVIGGIWLDFKKIT